MIWGCPVFYVIFFSGQLRLNHSMALLIVFDLFVSYCDLARNSCWEAMLVYRGLHHTGLPGIKAANISQTAWTVLISKCYSPYCRIFLAITQLTITPCNIHSPHQLYVFSIAVWIYAYDQIVYNGSICFLYLDVMNLKEVTMCDDIVVLNGYVQYIPRNMHTVFALLCFVVVIHWLIFPYPSGLLHWHSVPAKQPWWIWINTSCEFIMNDCITTTKQSTTKPCAYFLGYTIRYNSKR